MQIVAMTKSEDNKDIAGDRRGRGEREVRRFYRHKTLGDTRDTQDVGVTCIFWKVKGGGRGWEEKLSCPFVHSFFFYSDYQYAC